MYLTIVAGIISIKLYISFNKEHDEDVPKVLSDNNKIESQQQTEIKVSVNTDNEVSNNDPIKQKKVKFVWLKYLHAIFMIYSWVMLLGAGQAFLSNSRSNGFPYPQTSSDMVTDSLVGRCFARNLIAGEIDAPKWLTDLSCGLTSFCGESTNGGKNSYLGKNS